MVKIYLLLAALAVFAAAVLPQARAQVQDPFKRLDGPGCSDLINRSNVTIHGKIRTARALTKDGTEFRHEANFKIPPLEKWRACSEGPFYDGGRVELQIVTLLPVFRCYTRLGTPIYLTATRKIAGEGYNWHATCY